MDTFKALGYFMDYCNRNMGSDNAVTYDRFQEGMQVIRNSNPRRFEWCETAQDVLSEIHWPDVM